MSTCKFSIIQKLCQFCGEGETIKFSEHYYFCPECGTITTHSILLKKTCRHIRDNTWELIREPIKRIAPWKGGGKLKPIKPMIVNIDGEQCCSECGASCLADGW